MLLIDHAEEVERLNAALLALKPTLCADQSGWMTDYLRSVFRTAFTPFPVPSVPDLAAFSTAGLSHLDWASFPASGEHCNSVHLGNLGNPNGRRGRTAQKRKPLSVAARKKISAAQRARWAKWKARRSK